ncbi:MAG: transposase [Deltaproteobacteria bacterium]|nr:transposase [Deltaproteobacteria bacterium]
MNANDQQPERKTIRLPADCYRGGDAFSVTICVAGRVAALVGPVRDTVHRMLVAQSADNKGPVYGWVVMPDHLHVLIAGSEDLVRWVRLFKSGVTSSLKRRGGNPPNWPRSFYEHGVRRNERLEVVARYILENPVRAGLCDRFDKWPWSYVAGMKAAG